MTLLEKIELDIKGLQTINKFTIVILGNFNPAILHPEWFDRNQVLPPSEVRDLTEVKIEEPKGLEGIKIKFVSTNVFVSGIETRLSLPSYRVNVTPERFDASTSKNEKYEELAEFVAATFKILEHTPVNAIGINFRSSLKSPKPARDLMNQYFCGEPDILSSVFGKSYSIDTKIGYDYNDSKVTLLLDIKEKDDEIDINFNYNKNFTEEQGTTELIKYLLDNFKPMMLSADKTIRSLFLEPINGGEYRDKSA
ncbi:hypothetical protein C6A37_01365 [Desulfobacteraceae bacterium SEEP-SAG9]|nr:hypothetical protein C6A37_01365 [Desulfobacteraceae bacterium SEEP-SAG9]